jgi:hypothetical protein
MLKELAKKKILLNCQQKIGMINQGREHDEGSKDSIL